MLTHKSYLAKFPNIGLVSHLNRRTFWARRRGTILWVSLGRGQGWGCWRRGVAVPWLSVAVITANPAR
jgi:hypothetical protein